MVHLERVSKTYRGPGGAVEALRSLTLDIPTGQFAVVQGPSGCGKSTLLNVIGGLALPSSGRVIVAGQNLTAISAAARARFRARQIGFVFQTFHLVPYLTVWDNVVMAALPGEDAARDRARELLRRFGMDHRLRHRPSELSTGECQRVAIARALLNRPSLLLADEPTGNLDRENGAGVLELIGSYHQEGGTVLLVTHQEWVAGYGQRVIGLRDGGMVASGPQGGPPSA